MEHIFTRKIYQQMLPVGNKLYYYTWPRDDKHNYEIDFLLSRGTKICPVEVKSSNYKSHSSMDEFCAKFSKRISERYLIYTKDLRKDDKLLLVPFYMTMML